MRHGPTKCIRPMRTHALKSSTPIRWAAVGLAASLFLAASPARACDWVHWTDGFSVTATTPSGIPQGVGSSPQITGSVNRVMPDGSVVSEKNPALADLLTERHVHLRFYFGGEDVTKQVSLNSQLQFQYFAPPLQAQGDHTFVARLVHVSPDKVRLREALEETQSRITAIQDSLSTLSKEKSSKSILLQIAELDLELALRKAQAWEQELRLRRATELISEIELPLQVGNEIAGPARSLIVLNGYKVRVESTLGSAISGETSTLSTHIADLDEHRAAHAVDVQALWDGVKVAPAAPAPQTITTDRPIDFSYTTSLVSGSGRGVKLKRA